MLLNVRHFFEGHLRCVEELDGFGPADVLRHSFAEVSNESGVSLSELAIDAQA